MSVVPLEQRLAALIAARESGAREVRVEQLKPLTGGNARRIWAFDAVWRGGPDQSGGEHDEGRQRHERCVLLARAGQGQVEGDLAVEFAVLRAVAGAGLPVPRALWLDAGGDLLGMPGFVTGWLPGRASAAELLQPAAPHTRELVLQVVRLAARLHRLGGAAAAMVFPDAATAAIPVSTPSATPAAAPVGVPAEANLGRAGADASAAACTVRMLDDWEDAFQRHRLEPLPALASVFRWLRRHQPPARPATLVHGDLRIGNFLHEAGQVTALLDWELAHRGDPVEDLAWLYRPLWSPQAWVPIDEALALYVAESGEPVAPAHLAWWRIFCEARFAVISLTAARNFVDGRTDSLRLASRASTVRGSLELAFELIDQVEAGC